MFDYFDKVYCIHLPNDERREKIERQFERVGIKDVTYIHAHEPHRGFESTNMRRNPRGEFGANLSHIKAVITAISDKVQYPLFIEDDIEFVSNAPAKLQKVLNDIPASWDVLYFGGHPRGEYTVITDSVAKISTFSFAEAYAIQDWALQPFVDFWLNRIGQKDAMYDFILGEFAAENESYCAFPLLTHQPPGTFSYIANKPDDKSHCTKKGWDNNLCAD